jgi:hypothetical protein
MTEPAFSPGANIPPPLDPETVENAATAAETYLEQRRAWHATMRQVDDGGIDDSWPLTVATLQALVADYRHHRPTQDAYDWACAALHKRPTHTEHERALARIAELEAQHEQACAHEAWESRHAAELSVVKAERDEARHLARGLRKICHIELADPDDDTQSADWHIEGALDLDQLPDWLTTDDHTKE